jgi:hypothetical protein
VIRLSTTLDCWKKSCHGATVVPTSATARKTAPPCTVAVGLAATCPRCAQAITASGTAARLAAMSTYIARSQPRKLPDMVTAIRKAAATGTETSLLIPKYPSDSETPTNSVTSVSRFSASRSASAKPPQRRPNRAVISRACPAPVTAPRRAAISWLTNSTGTSSTTSQAMCTP